MEYGYKRYGGVSIGKNQEAVKRNRTELPKLFTIICAGRIYPGVGINLIAHIKNVRVPFSIDIGVDDIIIPGAVIRQVSTRLPDFQAPKVYTYSLESTLAEKFDAILKRMMATSRMKDFCDLYYIPYF